MYRKSKFLLFIILGFILKSCNEKLEYNSRQFKGEFSIKTETNKNKTFQKNIDYYYVLYSDADKYFDENGYFQNKKDSTPLNFEPLIYTATEKVFKNYTNTSFDSINSNLNKLQELILNSTNEDFDKWNIEKNIKVKLNAIIIKAE